MDFNPIRAKTKSSHEMENTFSEILGTIASTNSCIFGQLDGIWESM